MLKLPPLSLYVHLPWCARKCPYCDFNSHQQRGQIPEAEYVRQLLADLEIDLQFAARRALQSIFIGGGTPSLFSTRAIGSLLDGVRARVKLSPDAEITLEANPGSSESGKFAGFRAAGVNRLSIGVQSFSPTSLRQLGRVHDAREAHAAIDAAQAAGFERINIDLMHGLPEQSPAAACADLEQAIAHGVTHVSWYQLTVEPNTVFHAHPPVLPPEETLAEIQHCGHECLSREDFAQYEVSAYARAGAQSRHNLNYWHFGDYIGIGAGAHGKLTDTSAQGVLRTWKTRSPGDYLARAAERPGAQRTVTRDELPLEYLMNVLRLREGGSFAEFSDRTGLDSAEIVPTVEALRREGLLRDDAGRLCATDIGYRFLDSVLARFIRR